MKPVDFSWLELPVRERRPLKHAPTVLTVFQIRFHTVLRVDQEGYIAPFQDAVRADYPVYEPAPRPPKIQVQVEGLPLEMPADQPRTWLFRDSSRNWTVTLSREALSIETRAYQGFEDFRARLERLLEALVAHVVPTLAVRIGLRYLNELRQPGEYAENYVRGSLLHGSVDWTDIVKREMLGLAASPLFQQRLQRSLEQLVLLSPDGIEIAINHGIVPEGSMVDPPSERSSSNPFYALDLDVYQEFKKTKEPAINPGRILERVDAFHEVGSRIFRWSLADSYLDAL